MHGEPEEEDEPALLSVPLTEAMRALPSIRATEEALSGSFFIGVKGGVQLGGEGDPESRREGDVSGVSNGVSAMWASSP